MSITEHPHANAVGLALDLVHSIKQHKRGKALELSDNIITEIAFDVAELIHQRLEMEIILHEVRKDEKK